MPNKIALQNKDYQLIAIAILFVAWALSFSKTCPCGERNKHKRDGCYRFEIMGVQTIHLYFYIFIGYVFPNYFWTVQIAGVLWELFEMYLDHNEPLVNKFGGCLSERDPTIGNPWYNKHLVVAGENKYLNPIDRFFGIKNSMVHGWHGSVAEIGVNIIGFGIGYIFYKYLNKYYNLPVTMFIISLVFMEQMINL